MFGPKDDQAAVFAHFQPVVGRLFEGVSCSVIAYGHTGSGKTHTMYGQHWPALVSRLVQADGCLATPGSQAEEFPGLVLRLADQVFRRRDEAKSRPSVSVRYFQIYNEKIIDLLTVDHYHQGLDDLKVKVDAIGIARVEGAMEILVESMAEFLLLLERGETQKITKATQFNVASSRSHTVLELSLKGKGEKEITLSLCDLAGSEKFSDDKLRDKSLLAESKNINRSLGSLTR